ncbi:MAG: aspartyl-tRNA synthetase [Candidatus Berkelbacteria bacterium Athens1014_28]|uniref:Aspartate--tRNA(Asp/Asn) ligase n=1 Tax=Candidatus Berkelbacteria bacterium Athens1014_28 TaxID=2017145 RepID=A0A554LR26_9BACT|nr:MAG: aspartyl-tRNA synthetase [Candidatus Berkelbacteria bacterium Athens1014_28]
MERVMSVKTKEFVGKKISVSGWIHTRRDHGKLIFFDLRDRSGLLQIVVLPNSNCYEVAQKLRPEWVVEITGAISKRPEKLINKNLESGEVELCADEIVVLNEAKTPPFEIDKNTKNVEEELRLKYRYLDLRSERMAKNITLRHEIVKFIREFLYARDFREIETPYLTKSTPEGAREYIVPSRLYPGDFYVLPQSPQQFKQLLMVGGIERYFQIARCFRDEDQRGDRQPEFTQLDLEMSFVEQEDILSLVEEMMIGLVKNCTPENKITSTPFPRIKFADSIDKYQTDKPDLRKNKNDKNELSFCWIIDPPLFKYSKSEKKLVSTHHPFTFPNLEDMINLDKEPDKVRALGYDLVLNGFEIAGGSIRIHIRELQDKIFNLLGVSEDEKHRRFGHMLEAFEYGAPPHGGIAPGIDRIAAILAGEDVIREAIAFPKTGDARDVMMGAPSAVSEKQLSDVHIKLTDDAKGKALKETETQTNE